MNDVNEVVIYYGSKNGFTEMHPEEYRSLTDLVVELERDRKKVDINIPGKEPESHEKEKLYVENLVITSDEYAGVREHVITNFVNFIAKVEVDNLYLHNPPLQISEQIKRIYSQAKIFSQDYAVLDRVQLKQIYERYDSIVIGQEEVKKRLLQTLFPLTMPRRTKPVVMLFYGNSGIGKTETANFLADILGEKIFRKQFSMFQNNQFSTYLFGGAHFEKSFAKDLLDRESNVILLDEFDKANEYFHSAFYQLFDEGIYEDQNYHLKMIKSIIICTSNYNSISEIKEKLGLPIYNRFDAIIHFKDLSVDAKLKIGRKIYDKKFAEYKEAFNIEYPTQYISTLEKAYIERSNVREIQHLIEDVLAYEEINKIISNDRDNIIE